VSDKLYVIRWQVPPESKRPPTAGRRTTMYDEAAAELRANPGMWGVIYEGRANRASGMVAHILSGAIACFRPAGSFRATSRTRNGVRTVYARYLGDGDG